MPRIGRSMFVLLITMLGFGCMAEVSDSPPLVDAESVHQALLQEGMTCEVLQAMENLDEEEQRVFTALLGASMTGDEFNALARNRETDCETLADTGVAIQALADYDDDWTFETIDDGSIGGSSVQTTGWEVDPVGMCGPDYDDGIWEVNNLPYSHQFRQYLRFTGTDGFGNCVEGLASGFDSRVYTDNSIRMCIRSSHLGWCDIWHTPQSYSFTVGFQ